MHVKKFFLFLAIFFSNIACADVIIFNDSSRYSIDVAYNFCSGDNNYTCTPTESIKIDPSYAYENSSYASIQVPPVTVKQQFFNIISATRKDNAGKVIAQALYNTNEIDGFNCGASTISNENFAVTYRVSTAFYLKENGELPIIPCQIATYNKELIPNK